MKKITNYILICTCALGFSSCVNTFLDLEPLDAKTDVIYFKTPEHFREYANGLYGQLLGWQSSYGSIFDHMDAASDLSTCFRYSYGVGTGVMGVPNDDSRWGNCYGNIRATNHMFERAVSSYTGNLADIKKELAEGHFFRAYNYFYLLKFFGGVPVVTKVLDVTSPELYGKRNSRYEVVNLILSDLDEAIAGLPLEQNITSADKGKISKQAAQAFKARVLLYEATWRKYNGTSTDFEGSAGPASDQVNTFLEESVQLSEIVMGDAAYSLWNYNNVAAMKNLSSRYLFNIEEEASNPAGAGRATNKEFIIASVYSQETRKGQVDLNRVIYTDMRPSRKLIDMFLCTDGLPVSMSDKFQGYKNPGDEFQNRDFRLTSYVGSYSTSLTVESCGYGVSKFAITDIQRQSKDESANYPVLRLAEVYLNYAEACVGYGKEGYPEKGMAYLDKVRERAGLKPVLESWANAKVPLTSYDGQCGPDGRVMKIVRQERMIELYQENHNFWDIRRWKMGETYFNVKARGLNILAETMEDFAKIVEIQVKRTFDAPRQYLMPIPAGEVSKNPNMVQNPGY